MSSRDISSSTSTPSRSAYSAHASRLDPGPPRRRFLGRRLPARTGEDDGLGALLADRRRAGDRRRDPRPSPAGRCPSGSKHGRSGVGIPDDGVVQQDLAHQRTLTLITKSGSVMTGIAIPVTSVPVRTGFSDSIGTATRPGALASAIACALASFLASSVRPHCVCADRHAGRRVRIRRILGQEHHPVVGDLPRHHAVVVRHRGVVDDDPRQLTVGEDLVAPGSGRPTAGCRGPTRARCGSLRVGHHRVQRRGCS
jgi:hypothetical protein